jgi:predicted dehydrogenase
LTYRQNSWTLAAVFRTLVVGLGRAGAGLHLPVLLRLRPLAPRLFANAPIVTVDPDRASAADPERVVHAASLDAAGGILDPAGTVVHVCTAPDLRALMLTRLAEAGFRRIIVEKPLAVDEDALAEVVRVRDRYGLRLVVVAHWLASTLTERLRAIVAGGEFGALREITVRQHKPRFRRGLADGGHTSAFDVEIPHSLGVALDLAGPADLVAASWHPMTVGDVTLPRLGGAWLALRHAGGVRTDIASNLTSPTRERRIALRFDDGEAIGHYPGSADDEYAQLRVTAGTMTNREVFPDDALSAFLLRSYQHFATGAPFDADLARQAEVTRLIAAAKRICGECDAR